MDTDDDLATPPRAQYAEHCNMSTLTLTSVLENVEQEMDEWHEKSADRGRYWQNLAAALSFMLDLSSVTSLASQVACFGGLAYIVARLACIIFLGAPLLFFESAIGRSSQSRPLTFFSNLRPMFSGVGLSIASVSFCKSIVDVSDIVKEVVAAYGPVYKVLPPVQNETAKSVLETLTDFEPTALITISTVWLLVALISAIGWRVLRRVVFVTLVLPIVLLVTLTVLMWSSHPLACSSRLSDLLSPQWERLLAAPLWLRACFDTVCSLKLGCGVIMSLAGGSPRAVNWFRSALWLTISHTAILAILTVFSCAAAAVQTGDNVAFFSQRIAWPGSAPFIPTDDWPPYWRAIFTSAAILLNIDGLFLNVHLLSTWTVRLRWRPVVAVLTVACLYVASLPLTWPASDEYVLAMSAPAAGVVTLMAMQLSTVAGMKGVRLLNVLESAARWRLGLCGKSALLVSFAVVLPLALALCAVYGMLLARSPPDRIGPVVDWAAPVAIVLAPLLLVPAVAAAFCFRNMTISERLEKLVRKVDNYDWVFGDRQRDVSALYEMPRARAPPAGAPHLRSYYSRGARVVADGSVMY